MPHIAFNEGWACFPFRHGHRTACGNFFGYHVDRARNMGIADAAAGSIARDDALLSHFGIHVRCLISILLPVLAEGLLNNTCYRFLPLYRLRPGSHY
jgi:hypothetical protein